MCRTCLYKSWLEKMEEMLDDFRFERSFSFIESIYEWVEEKEHITERQIDSLKNISKRGH